MESVYSYGRGVIAQLVERYDGIVEVWGSTPHGSTTRRRRGAENSPQIDAAYRPGVHPCEACLTLA